MVSLDCCVALPCGVMGLSAVCDCGISRLYALTISEYMHTKNKQFCTFLVYSFESNQLGKPSF